MHDARFNALTRGLAAHDSRRWLLTAALGGTLGLLGLAHPDDAAGKKRKKGKKRKPCRNCARCERCKKGNCRPKATGTFCAGGYRRGGACLPAFCAGQDHCLAESFCSQPGSAVGCNCFVTAGSGVPFCGQNGYAGDAGCADCEPGDACVTCGDSVFCQQPCANPV